MTYQAGIIGTGGIAGMGILGLHDPATIGREKVRASHAGGYEATDGIELHCIADVDAENRRTFGEAWEIPMDRRYADHEAMLTEEDLDVVSVCTPTLYHHDHVLDAIRLSDPRVVWCEKPIATAVADAEEMTDACADADVELVVNHSFRFCAKHAQLRRLIREEQLLGQVHSAAVQFRMELVRNSTHVLDTLQFLLDTEPRQASGYLTGAHEATDALEATETVADSGGGGYVVMRDGTFATIDCTIPRADSSMHYSLIGDRGKLSLNNDDGEWRYWTFEDGKHVETPLSGLDGTWSWTEDYAAAFPRAARHIVELLDEATENRSPGTAATQSLAVIVAFYLSHHTGGTVRFPLDESLKTVRISSW